MAQLKGASWNTTDSKWVAQITTDREKRPSGYFNDEQAAARTYDEAAAHLVMQQQQQQQQYSAPAPTPT
jgi:hypothetical protein